MSVYKSRRKDAAAQFVADARELRKFTVRTVRRFPKSYRDTINCLCELAREIYINALKGMDERFTTLFAPELAVRKSASNAP